MISLNNPEIPVPHDSRDFDSMRALLAIVADPAAARARLEELAAAEGMLRESKDQLEADRSALENERQDMHATLGVKAEAAKAELTAERSAFENEVRQRSAALDAREVA